MRRARTRLPMDGGTHRHLEPRGDERELGRSAVRSLRFTFVDGTRYEGGWSAGKPHGWGVAFFPTGAVYEGPWVGGKRETAPDEMGHAWFADGTMYRVRCQAGRLGPGPPLTAPPRRPGGMGQ